MAFLLDVTPHAPPQSCSSLMLVLLLLLNTTSPTPFQQPSSSMLLLLLPFLDVIIFPWCDTFSSLTQLLLLLLHATPTLLILGSSLLPLDVVVFHFWCCSYFPYFRLALLPPHSRFCKCGRTKLSKFNFFKPDLEGEVVCWWLITCFDYPYFFWIILIGEFCLLCVRIIWTLYI
jgi:hypothetical protein